jgi:hypothetical protein
MSDDGGSKDVLNVSKFLPLYAALQHRRQPLSLTPEKSFDLGGMHELGWEGARMDLVRNIRPKLCIT